MLKKVENLRAESKTTYRNYRAFVVEKISGQINLAYFSFLWFNQFQFNKNEYDFKPQFWVINLKFVFSIICFLKPKSRCYFLLSASFFTCHNLTCSKWSYRNIWIAGIWLLFPLAPPQQSNPKQKQITSYFHQHFLET